MGLGFTTSGGYGHYTQKSIAMAYIFTDKLLKKGNNDNNEDDEIVQVHLLGEKKNARIIQKPLYDPECQKMFA